MLRYSGRASRNLVVGIATSGILPLINRLSVSVANALSALIALLGFWYGIFLFYSGQCLTVGLFFSCLWLTVRYGQRLRTWVDVGLPEE